MFSDEWDDNRTPTQKEQDDERDQRLPNQRALFADEALDPPAPLTGLPERSRERTEAPELSIFGDWASVVDDAEGAQVAEFAAAPEHPPTRSQEAVYLELIQLAQDVAETIWIDPLYEDRYQAQMRVTVIEARASGLTDVEIDLAFLIGESRGRRSRQQHR